MPILVQQGQHSAVTSARLTELQLLTQVSVFLHRFIIVFGDLTKKEVSQGFIDAY